MLVARDGELAALRRALARAAEGITTLVSLEGPAGIGKTALLEALAPDVVAAGFTVVAGRGDEIEQGRAFGPLADALGLQVGQHPGPSAGGGTGALEARRMAAVELLRAGPAESVPLVLAAVPNSRHQVTTALCELVEQMALEGPLALVLEDVHWADPSTLAAVRAIARRVEGYRLLLIVTTRPAVPPVPREWVQLMDACDTAVRVDPLPEDGRTELLRSALGVEPGPRLRALLAGTDGVPLLIDELVRSLGPDALVRAPDGSADVPVGFVPVGIVTGVERRLRQVAPATIELLRAASVFGSPVGLDVVAQVLARPVARLLPAVQEGIREGLLADSGAVLTFRHDLLREAVAASMPSVVRATLHGEVARALIARRAPAAVIASHFEAVGADADEDTVRDWLTRAALETIDRSPSVARRLLERARSGLDPADPRWASLSFRSLEAAATAGMVPEAMALGEELLGHPLEAEVRGVARWWFGASLFMGRRPVAAADQFELAAEERASPGDRALLLAYAAMARLGAFTADSPRAIARALQAATESGDPRALSLALSLESRRLGGAMRFREALPVIRRAMEVAASDPSGRAGRHQPAFFLGIGLYDLGRFDEALQVVRHGQQQAERHGAAWADALYLQLRALVLYQTGRLDEADADAAAGLAATEETGSAIAVLWSLAVMAHVALNRGRLDDARDAIDRAEAIFGAGGAFMGIDLVVSARARLLLGSGRVDEAVEILQGAWQLFGSMEVDITRERIAHDLVCALTIAGRTEEVGPVVEEVRSWRGRDPSSHRLARLAVEVAAVASGGVDPSAGPVDESRDPWVQDRIDRRRVLQAVVDARSGATVRAAPPGEPAPNDLADTWHHLSAAEQRVCLAIGRGLSNKAIAAELYLSIRTVETHVSRILRKMGASSRLQLGLIVRSVAEDAVLR